MGDVTMAELLARLEAMAARLDDQAGQIDELTAENAGLKAQMARLVPVVAEPQQAHAVAEPREKRRGMLRKVLGATAAAALLTIAKEAATAEAAVRATSLSGTGS